MDEFFGFPNTLFTFPEVAFKEFSSGLRKSLEFAFGGANPRIKTTRFLHHFTQR